MEEIYPEEQKPYMEGRKFKIFMIFTFLVIISVLIYTSFYGSFSLPTSFTGNTVLSEENLTQERIKLDAKLETIPLLELDGNFKRILIEGKESSEDIY